MKSKPAGIIPQIGGKMFGETIVSNRSLAEVRVSKWNSRGPSETRSRSTFLDPFKPLHNSTIEPIHVKKGSSLFFCDSFLIVSPTWLGFNTSSTSFLSLRVWEKSVVSSSLFAFGLFWLFYGVLKYRQIIIYLYWNILQVQCTKYKV